MTPQRCEQLPGLIADAERQYHMLQIGRSARVVVDQNGERVEFTAANRAGLYAYITGLKAELAKCPGQTSTVASIPRGPVGFIF